MNVFRIFHGNRRARCSIPVFAMLAIAAGTMPLQAQNGVPQPVTLRPDDAPSRARPGLVKGSHVKVFIPSLPYLYTSHSINAALIKPSDNERGWEYDMAVNHREIDPTTYEFELRRGVQFQDGSRFNADSVVLNMEYFKKNPVKYSKINKVFDRAEKVDDYTVRFYLTEKYGSFINDVIWMQFYTEEYLRLNPGGWNGKASCPNLSRPGPFGLGPYILTEGYIEGDRAAPKAVLQANPFYWNPDYPKVETITVFTQLDSLQAKEMALYQEGELDVTIIPPEDKVETILAPFSKLVITPSTDNIAIHINMINGNPQLRDTSIRRALNQALDRNNLLHFAYEDEGHLSPISPLFPGVRDVYRRLMPFQNSASDPGTRAAIGQKLQGLRLKVLTQDRFLPMWRGIETQLARVHAKLDIELVRSENEIFNQLLNTNASRNEKPWDLLVWGNDDWYFSHPFTAFFVFRTNNVWSTVYDDPIMNGHIEEMFRVAVDDPGFAAICEKIMRRAYDEAYMLFVPTPNKVFAVNKEVVFEPYKMACMPLWKIQVTDQHWSVRAAGLSYPSALRRPVKIFRADIHNGPKP